MQVVDLMNAPVYSVSPEDTVGHVKNVMLKHKIGRVAVAYEGALVGVIVASSIVLAAKLVRRALTTRWSGRAVRAAQRER